MSAEAERSENGRDSATEYSDATLDSDAASPGKFAETIHQDPDETRAGIAIGEDGSLQGKHFGEYELIQEIARGGMGVVYKARQKGLDRIVALKMILSGALAGEKEIKRFQAEARAAARLEHSGIVPVHDVGQLDGHHFFTMGFVEGKTLASLIRHQPLSGKATAGLIAEVADAMAFAHSNGVIHRDLKPSNVLIDADGKPRVSDFGLAKQADSDSELTGTGQVLGTPSYMAPEQARGDVDNIGPISDVYALGATLYFMLTGRAPFYADSVMDTLLAVINQEPVPPRSLNTTVDKDLETICLKCLEKEPRARYQSALELRDELLRYQSGKPIVARPISTTARTTRWCRRNPSTALLLGAVATTLITGVVASLALAGRWQQSASDAISQTARANRAKLVADTERDTARAERDEADLARKREADARRLAEQATAINYLDRGQVLCEEGELARGLHWIAKSIKLMPDSATEYDHLARSVFLARTSQLNTLQRISHHRGVYPIELAPNADTYAAFDSKRIVEIWSLSKGIQTCSRLKHPRKVIRGVFSPDSAHLFCVCLGTDRIIRWDLATGSETKTKYRFKGDPLTLAVHPQGNEVMVAVYANDATTVLRFDVHSGEQIGKPITVESPIVSLAYCPGSSQFAVCRLDGVVEIRDTETGSESRILFKQAERIHCVAFSPDGKLFATGDTRSVKVWDVESGALKWYGEHGATVYCIAFDHQGKQMLTGCFDQNARLWSVATGRMIGQPMEHGFAVSIVGFGENDETAISGAYFQTKEWSIRGEEPLRTIYRANDSIRTYAIMPAGQMAIASGNRVAFIKSLNDPSVTRLIESPATINHVKVSADARRVLAGCNDKTVRVWDIQSGEMLGVVPHVGSAALWSNSDKNIITMPTAETLQIWDASSLTPIGSRMHAGYSIESTRLTPDEKYLIAIGPQQDIRAWDAITGEDAGPQSALSHTINPSIVSYHPNDDRLLVAGFHHVFVRNRVTGETLHQIDHQGFQTVATFSPDGKYIATGAADATVRLWSADDYSLIGNPISHLGIVRGATFSSDSRLLLTRGMENEFHLIDVQTGKPLGWSPPVQSELNIVSFGLDSSSVITATSDGLVQSWATPSAFSGTAREADDKITILTGIAMDDKGGIDVQMAPFWNKTRLANNVPGASRTFVVTNTQDSGLGSLRSAIQQANANYGNDKIEFQIPGDNVQTIRPKTALPNIDDVLTIDGTSQADYVGSPRIELDGSVLTGKQNGLVINVSDCVIRGLAINRFPRCAIVLVNSDRSLIVDNYFGLDPSGTKPRGNGHAGHAVGIHLNSGCEKVRLVGNIVTANGGPGIVLANDSSQCRVEKNFIGLNEAGDPFPNNNSAIRVYSELGNIIRNNKIAATNHDDALYVDTDSNEVADNALTVVDPQSLVHDPELSQEAEELRQDADKLVETGDIKGAIALLDRVCALPWMSMDDLQVGDLYARTMQWKKAANAFEREKGPLAWQTLACLYESGELTEFRKRRNKLLDTNLAKRKANWELSMSRICQLTRVDSNEIETVRMIAMANSPDSTKETWRHQYVAPLMYRINEFDAWYESIPSDSSMKLGSELPLLITNFKRARTQENKDALEAEIRKQHVSTIGSFHFGDIGKYWHNYVIRMAMIREAYESLGVANSSDAGRGVRDLFEWQERGRAVKNRQQLLELIELYEGSWIRLGPRIQAKAIREFYARAFDWEKAVEANANVNRPSDPRALHLLFQSGQLDRYRRERKSTLKRWLKEQKQSWVEQTRAITLLPLEDDPELYQLCKELAERFEKSKFSEDWHRVELGRLRFRLGELENWLKGESDPVKQSREIRTCILLDSFRSNPSEPNRKQLEKISQRFQAAFAEDEEYGFIKTEYWWTYVLAQSFIQEVETVLGGR